jgi:E3 ubiquitin-protein ligase MARCH6
MAEIADRVAAGELPEDARPPSAGPEDEEEDEGDVCRICRNRGDEEHPLRYPCACSGSIKFVHQNCLLQWLDHSNSRQCEVSRILSLAVALGLWTGSITCLNRQIGC